MVGLKIRPEKVENYLSSVYKNNGRTHIIFAQKTRFFM